MRTRLTVSGAMAMAAVMVCTASTFGSGGSPRVDTSVRWSSGEFHSTALGSTLHFVVQLPRGYGDTARRYPVVYFLHGLPASPTAYQGVGWVGRALTDEAAPAILVAPQGTRGSDDDPEYHDWGPGRNWATALAVELPRWVDSHYRTIADRSGRAILGVSAGGYGASSIGLAHPATFSVVESWSGYFEPTDPTGATPLELGSQAADDAASVHRQAAALARQFRRYPTFFGFYVGRSDPMFLDENIQLNQELSAVGVRHAYATYPGGHATAFWQAHARYWLQMALSHLARAR